MLLPAHPRLGLNTFGEWFIIIIIIIIIIAIMWDKCAHRNVFYHLPLINQGGSRNHHCTWQVINYLSSSTEISLASI
jgi:hypothetical protein